MNVMGSQAWFQAPCKTYIITNDCYLTWLQKNGGRLLVNEINYVSFDETHTHIYIYICIYIYRQIDRYFQKIFPNELQTIVCCHSHWPKFIVFDKSYIPIEIAFEIFNVAY